MARGPMWTLQDPGLARTDHSRPEPWSALGPSQKKGIKRLTDTLLNRSSTWAEELMSVEADGQTNSAVFTL